MNNVFISEDLKVYKHFDVDGFLGANFVHVGNQLPNGEIELFAEFKYLAD